MWSDYTKQRSSRVGAPPLIADHGPRDGGLVEYTDQPRAAFNDAYARRWQKQPIMFALLFAAMTPLPFIEDGYTFFGVQGAIVGPVAPVALVALVAIAINLKQCCSCSMELRG